MTIVRLFLGLLTLTFACSCSGRLNDLGQDPAFTPIGQNQEYLAGLDRQHAAVLASKPKPPSARYAEGSLWNSGPTSLFGDRRAQGLGDIMTIVIEISEQASINNSSNRARSGADDLSIPNFLGIPQILNRRLPEGADLSSAVGVSSSSSASGNGSISRNEEITLRIAATVVDILPNGHMVVKGNQEVRVNQELRDLQVAGIVRPEDISRQNEITYDKIAGARISYGGRGTISDMQQPRYGQQLADTILPY